MNLRKWDWVAFCQNSHSLTLLTRMCYLHLCFSLAGRCPRTRKCQFHFFLSVLPQSGSVHLDCQSTKRTWRILSLWCICDAFVYKWKSAPLIGVAVKMFASRSTQIFRKFVFRISPDQISSFLTEEVRDENFRDNFTKRERWRFISVGKMLMESARSRDLSKVRRLPTNGGWGQEDNTVQEWFKHVNRTLQIVPSSKDLR